MLSIHHSHSLRLPHPRAQGTTMRLGTIRDDDELITSIQKDHEDNHWVLSHDTDAADLDAFWSGVQSDLRNDPTWFDFAED